jgi:hypothetical protein
MGKLVLRKTILRNMIDRVWAALLWGLSVGGAKMTTHRGQDGVEV